MKFSTSILILLSVLFFSCNKDDSTPQEEQQVSEPNFYALKVGNTWTYEYFERVGNTDEFVTTNAFDEVEIIGTSEINGETFYSFQTTTTGNDGAPGCVPANGTVIEKLRDSLGYLINDGREILFSNKNESEYMAFETPEDFYDLYATLIPGSEIIEVAAGSISCLRNELYAKFNDETTSPGRNFIFYSDGTGQVKETYNFVSDPINFAERRLVSYEIAE